MVFRFLRGPGHGSGRRLAQALLGNALSGVRPPPLLPLPRSRRGGECQRGIIGAASPSSGRPVDPDAGVDECQSREDPGWVSTFLSPDGRTCRFATVVVREAAEEDAEGAEEGVVVNARAAWSRSCRLLGESTPTACVAFLSGGGWREKGRVLTELRALFSRSRRHSRSAGAMMFREEDVPFVGCVLTSPSPLSEEDACPTRKPALARRDVVARPRDAASRRLVVGSLEGLNAQVDVDDVDVDVDDWVGGDFQTETAEDGEPSAADVSLDWNDLQVLKNMYQGNGDEEVGDWFELLSDYHSWRDNSGHKSSEYYRESLANVSENSSRHESREKWRDVPDDRSLEIHPPASSLTNASSSSDLSSNLLHHSSSKDYGITKMAKDFGNTHVMERTTMSNLPTAAQVQCPATSTLSNNSGEGDPGSMEKGLEHLDHSPNEEMVGMNPAADSKTCLILCSIHIPLTNASSFFSKNANLPYFSNMENLVLHNHPHLLLLGDPNYGFTEFLERFTSVFPESKWAYLASKNRSKKNHTEKPTEFSIFKSNEFASNGMVGLAFSSEDNAPKLSPKIWASMSKHFLKCPPLKTISFRSQPPDF